MLLGPKLYEANWRDLTRAGYLANVEVTEVWCPMTPAFYREYLRAASAATRSALAVMNPVKCWAMDWLLKVHEARGDKIIVFSGAQLQQVYTLFSTLYYCFHRHLPFLFAESVFALKLYAQRYSSLAICGDTPMIDRFVCCRLQRRFCQTATLLWRGGSVDPLHSRLFPIRTQYSETFIRSFKTPSSGVNKLFLSRVGDVALDVPDANVIIQISSHYGSRLQEAQRMGRILRRGTAPAAPSAAGTAATGGVAAQPAATDGGGFHSFFYTLVSTDTTETYFSNKRRRYLVDQGYAYVVRPADALVGREAAAAAAAAAGIAAEGNDGNAPGFFSAAGLEALRASSRFVGALAEQLRVLEVVLRENVEEVEGREEALMAEYAPEYQPDNGSGAQRSAASDASGAGSAIPASSAARALTGRPSAVQALMTAANFAANKQAGGATSTNSRLTVDGGALRPGIVRKSLQGMSALAGGAGVRYLEFAAGSDQIAAQEAGEAVERRAVAFASKVPTK